MKWRGLWLNFGCIAYSISTSSYTAPQWEGGDWLVSLWRRIGPVFILRYDSIAYENEIDRRVSELDESEHPIEHAGELAGVKWLNDYPVPEKREVF